MPKSSQPRTGFTTKLARALRPYPPGARYLVGVSGGRDSVALLSGLVAAGYRRLVVCHLDHGLRGAESAGDAAFVRRLAEENELTAEIGAADVRGLARTRKLSLETAAREARYRFFARVAGRRRCRTLFLAHQADDQAETFLFNLLRGAGPAGLAAMAVESPRRVGRSQITIVRPLLTVWREEIDAYLRAGGIVWREDATNADPAHATRNRLRAEGLPLLETIMGRAVKPALWRAADILGAEEAWLDGLCAERWPSSEKLAVEPLRSRSPGEQRRIVRRWLAERGAVNVGYAEVEAVLSLLEVADGPAKVNLPGNRHARRRAGLIFLA